MKTYLLLGNYGVGNLGDEALKEYFLQTFPEVSWKVVSAHPTEGEVSRLPLGIRSFFSGSWKKTLKAIKESDGVVFGGGTLFTDIESLKACFLWGLHAWAAKRQDKPIILAFQGVGPFRTKIGEWITRKVVQWASFVSVRDQLSYERVESFGLNKNSILTFDPVITLITAKKLKSSSQKIFIVIPRRNSGNVLQKALSQEWSKGYDKLHILTMQPGDSEEKKFCKELSQKYPSEVRAVRSLEELGSEVCEGSFVLTERYHGAIAALALGKAFKTVSQGADDKLQSIQNEKDAEDVKKRVRIGEDALRKILVN